MSKLIFTAYALVLFFASISFADSCKTTINASDSFPCSLDIPSTTYTIAQDIYCETSCFSITAPNVTLDMNGHTITFGTTGGVAIANKWFQGWANSSNPNSWKVVSGSANRDASTWPDKTYDAILSSNASIQSSSVLLSGNQTYWYGAWISGKSGDNATISIRRSNDNTVLASSNAYNLERGFASEGYINSTDHLFKPSSNVNVYLQIDCQGSNGTKRLALADISPVKHFGIFHYRYPDGGEANNHFPDINTNTLFGGVPSGIVIKNGTITQGNAGAAQSYAIFLKEDVNDISANIQNVSIVMSGHNSGSILFSSSSSPSGGDLNIDGVNALTYSKAQFNRMHPVPEFDISVPKLGTVTIQNNDISNSPEYGIRLSGPPPNNIAGSTNIHNNNIRTRGTQTEPYAICIYNANNLRIFNNTIKPYRGRGILIDSSPSTGSFYNIEIFQNLIEDIYESQNFEYDVNGLESAGIRFRNYTGASSETLKYSGIR